MYTSAIWILIFPNYKQIQYEPFYNVYPYITLVMVIHSTLNVLLFSEKKALHLNIEKYFFKQNYI